MTMQLKVTDKAREKILEFRRAEQKEGLALFPDVRSPSVDIGLALLYRARTARALGNFSLAEDNYTHYYRSVDQTP